MNDKTEFTEITFKEWFTYIIDLVQRYLNEPDTLTTEEYEKAKELFDYAGQPFVWLDYEDENSSVSLDVALGWIERNLRWVDFYFGPGSVGFYVNQNWWNVYTARSQDFNTYKLWDANWDGVPDLGMGYVNYGWDAPTMKQYAGNQTLEGVNVDLNVY